MIKINKLIIEYSQLNILILSNLLSSNNQSKWINNSNNSQRNNNNISNL